MDLDPRLRDSRPSEAYTPVQAPSYKTNGIHLPPPRNVGPPGIVSRIPDHPYYSIPQNGPPILQPHPPRGEQDQQLESAKSTKATKQIDQQNGDIKRPRACEACRGLKVRCEPDPMTRICKRCAKAGRQCVITEPSRKRHKKADTKVAELERKVDELTSRLNGTKHRSSSEDDSDEEDEPTELSIAYEDGRSLSRVPSSRKRRKLSSPEDQFGTRDIDGRPTTLPTPKDLNQDNILSHHSRVPNTGTSGSGSSQIPPLDPALPSHEYADVVDLKILDSATAAKIFYHFVNNMAKHMPVVTFPPEITAGEIRQTKPTLFLAILSVASGQDYPGVQQVLLRKATRVYADSIVCRGEKSLELIQALQISSIWCKPDYKDNARPYQMISTAVVMAMAIGLGRQKKLNRGHGPGMWKDIQQSKNSTVDPSTKESRRAWLGCYTLSSNFATILRQPNLFRWNAYMDECVNVLEKSPDAIFYDRILCQWAKLQHLGDEFVETFDQDDVHSTLSSDAQSELESFKDRVHILRNQIPKDLRSVTPLTLGFQAIDLCILKTGVRHEANLEVLEAFGGEPFQLRRFEKWPLSTAGIEARRTIVQSIHALLDQFLSFSVEDVRTIPVFHFVCVAYAATCLLRIYTRAVEPDSELAKSVPLASLNVESYLSRLMDLLQTAARDGRSKLAQNFQLVMITLKSWYERRKSGRKPKLDLKLQAQPVDVGRDTPRLGYRRISVHVDKSSSITNKTLQKSDQEPKRDIAHPPNLPQSSTLMQDIENSPLHLLSQVATSNPPAMPEHHQLDATSSHEAWYPPYATQLIQDNPQQIPYTDNSQPYYSLQNGYSDSPNVYSGTYQNLNIDPGLEQAIGMTFGGEGDFCEMLLDEGYLGMQGLQAAQPGFNGTYDGVWNAS